MGQNIVEKIIKNHLIEGDLETGKQIGIKIDQTLTQDATGTMTYLQFEAMGIKKIKTDLSVSYIDHNTLQMGFENADDHKYLKSIAAKYGIYFSPAGNGICHALHLERFGIPGKTLLGSDSHTPTAGALGMLAIGAGGLNIALSMANIPFYLKVPKIIKINLINKLQDWVSSKDIILHLLQIFTTTGNKECILEYGGQSVKTLSLSERATITNMGAEIGVITSIFPSDEITYQFLKFQKREKDWQELKADFNAQYFRTIDIDLSKIVPLAACPHLPDNVCEIKKLSNIKVDQISIGSCTNGSYQDLMLVNHILQNKKIHPDVDLVIVPASRQIFEMLSRKGAITTFIKSGARVLESTCGFCIGAGQSPCTNGVSLRTSNRNFKGRSGTLSASVYLVSPAVAAASALTGKITDPRILGEYSSIKPYFKISIDDSIIPFIQDKKIKIIRGPNIGDPPIGEPIEDNINAQVMLKLKDKISTDEIMPAGDKLKYRSNIAKYSEFVFEPIDSSFSQRCLENKKNKIANIIIAGLSYGQGSSREHAALCPMYLGVKCVIVKSFERIHQVNLINAGIFPLLFIQEQDYDKIKQGDKIEILNIREKIKNEENLFLSSDNYQIELKYDLSLKQREIILAGGMLKYVSQKK